MGFKKPQCHQIIFYNENVHDCGAIPSCGLLERPSRCAQPDSTMWGALTWKTAVALPACCKATHFMTACARARAPMAAWQR